MSVRIVQGDCLASLQKMESESVQCCVTSPPYFGLRDYGVEGQLGLEATPDLYVERMVGVFREVRRVLRGDGTLWLNIGDSYAGSFGAQSRDKPGAAPLSAKQSAGRAPQVWGTGRPVTAKVQGCKPKDLIGIPWMLAFALRADGWYLRSDIIWHKPNPMPESVTDRPTKSHEHLFLLSKSERYYYDAMAIAEPSVTDEDRPHGVVRDRVLGYDSKQAVLSKRPSVKRGEVAGKTNALPGREAFRAVTDTRNKRTVWSVNSQPYSGAHFATFPPKLIEPCILAGSSAQACEKCGSPWERVTEREKDRPRSELRGKYAVEGAPVKIGGGSSTIGHSNWHDGRHEAKIVTTGWKPTCNCENEGTARCTILDPFFGAGTTGLVASRLNRDCIGFELNPEYVKIAERRIHSDSPLFNQPEVA